MKRLFADKPRNKTILFSSVVFLLLAHLYRWTNAMFNHDSLLIRQGDYGWQISLGRIFNPVYVLFRGKLVSPPLVAMFASVFLIASIFLCCHILGLKKKSSLILVSGLLTTFETISFVNASFLLSLDLDMLALLFAVLAAFFLLEREIRPVLRYPAAVVCGTLSLGLFQSYIEVTILLVILVLLRELLCGETALRVFLRGAAAVAALLLTGGVYYICLQIVWRFTGISPANSYNSLSMMTTITPAAIPGLLRQTWRFPFRYLFSIPETAHRAASIRIHVFLFVFLLWEIFRRLREQKAGAASVILTLFLLGVLPLGCNCSFFLTHGLKHGLMTYSFAFYAVWAVMLYDDLPPVKALEFKNAKAAAVACACGVLILNHIMFAQQLYLKKDLEFKAGYSFMTRLVMRMEETEGYHAGQTKIAILGHVDENPLSHTMKGMDFVKDIFIGTTHHLTISYYGTYPNYFEYILDYPYSPVPLSELHRCISDPAVQQMPVYPEPGSVAMIGDTLVVRLSEDLRPYELR